MNKVNTHQDRNIVSALVMAVSLVFGSVVLMAQDDEEACPLPQLPSAPFPAPEFPPVTTQLSTPPTSSTSASNPQTSQAPGKETSTPKTPSANTPATPPATEPVTPDKNSPHSFLWRPHRSSTHGNYTRVLS